MKEHLEEIARRLREQADRYAEPFGRQGIPFEAPSYAIAAALADTARIIHTYAQEMEDGG